MPRRAKVDVPEPRRAAMLRDLRILAELEEQARLDKVMYVSKMYDAGMELREIAEAVGVTAPTALRWKREGEAERERQRNLRGSGDPGRSGEPEPIG